MSVKTLPPPVTPDQLLALPDGDHYELIDGVPKEKPMGAESDKVAVAVATEIRLFLRQHRLGEVYGSSTGFQCFPGKPNRVRLPDVSFVSFGKLPGGKTPKGYIQAAPDLAVESISPNDLYEEVEDKVADFRSAGVRLIWVISPESRTVLIRRLDRSCAELDETGTLSGEDVLPGFSCPVAELFV